MDPKALWPKKFRREYNALVESFFAGTEENLEAYFNKHQSSELRDFLEHEKKMRQESLAKGLIID